MVTDRWINLALIAVAVCITLLVLFACVKTEAAPLTGNRGGCNISSRWYSLACTVQDAGVGWVAVTCQVGEYGLFQTARTFRPQQPVKVKACEDQYGVLFSTPGWPVWVR